MSSIQAVVFDMDGILIDSEVLWRQVREEFAADNGMVWSAEDQASTMGCNTRMWSRIMVERLQLQERLGMDDATVTDATPDGVFPRGGARWPRCCAWHRSTRSRWPRARPTSWPPT